ncbi:hypothetical protein GWI33_019591 [Rhynchophorus ferrugineus]|uniref:C2H2-type domain-containing protein n=1 Tax=Rhynchophorus ferrugineus TaxID=354439 RepID=A0A834M558_RHYFE|nr:hypothetical protein GWI33_019591 [Rhynchophorus ferrugineus]
MLRFFDQICIVKILKCYLDSIDKPHKCNLCSKSFPTPGDLRSHMYVHSGSWPFKCHICSRGFSKHTNLKNHLFLHTENTTPFPLIKEKEERSNSSNIT